MSERQGLELALRMAVVAMDAGRARNLTGPLPDLIEGLRWAVPRDNELIRAELPTPESSEPPLLICARGGRPRGAAQSPPTADGILYEIEEMAQAQAIVELVETLEQRASPDDPPPALVVVVPSLGDPAAWLERASRPALEALRRLPHHGLAIADDPPPGSAAAQLLELMGVRELDRWTQHRPGADQRAAARGRLAFAPVGVERELLLRALRPRSAAELTIRWGLAALVGGALLIAGVVGVWIERDRLQLAAAEELASAERTAEAVDAYVDYLTSHAPPMVAERRQRARQRLATLAPPHLAIPADDADALEAQQQLLQRLSEGRLLPPATLAEARDRLDRRGALLALARELRELGDAPAEPEIGRNGGRTRLSAIEQLVPALLGGHAVTRWQELPPPLPAQIAPLLARREAERERVAWLRTRDAYEAAETPQERAAACQRYLERYPEGPAVPEVRKLLGEADEALARVAWGRVIAEIPGASARQRLRQVEAFLARYPSTSVSPEARAQREALRVEVIQGDWERSLWRSRDERHTFRERRAELESHLERVAPFKPSQAHQDKVKQEIAALLASWEVERFAELGNRFRKNPASAPEVAAALETFLEDFPRSAKRQSAERFLAWWRELAKPRQVSIRVQRAAIDKAHVSVGAEWTPDPYVILKIGRGSARTPNGSGYAPRWNTLLKLRWQRGQTVRLEVLDADHNADDPMFNLLIGDLLSLARHGASVRHPDGHKVYLRLEGFPLPKLE